MKIMKMKKLLCTLLCCVMLLLSLPPAAQAAGMRAVIASDTVVLNGQTIDNAAEKYPLLVYNDITYFPMTYDLCRFLGLSADWDGKTLSIAKTGETGGYTPVTGSSRSGRVNISRVTYPVVVNGAPVDNANAKWPLINYSDVTYFPLTWAFAVDEFGWDYKWDAVGGLRIESVGGATPDSAVTDSAVTMEIMGIQRAWGPMAALTPEVISVELDSVWTLEGIQGAIRQELEKQIFQDTELEGRVSEVNISLGFRLPAQMQAGQVLTVPYRPVYEGSPRVLSNGETFAPASTTSYDVNAEIRLTGQGVSAPAEATPAQKIYDRLAACVKLDPIEVAANQTFDEPNLVMEAVRAKLAADGLADRYSIQSISFGTHKNILAAGTSETVDVSLDFAPVPLDASAETGIVPFSIQVTFAAK